MNWSIEKTLGNTLIWTNNLPGKSLRYVVTGPGETAEEAEILHLNKNTAKTAAEELVISQIKRERKGLSTLPKFSKTTLNYKQINRLLKSRRCI